MHPILGSLKLGSIIIFIGIMLNLKSLNVKCKNNNNLKYLFIKI
jgi:hypothetical protein